ncbi:MAG: DUF1330 domain-containing protein [Rhizobiales bacterium]|nr:DUF1330 domain-containing protein [Hyphomicrobiales bacterium]
MPKGYVIARANVTNGVEWAKYAAAATKVMAQYGGKPIVRGGRNTIAEGEGRARNIIVEFESFEQAQKYIFSTEYDEARKLRAGAGVIDIVVVEGA